MAYRKLDKASMPLKILVQCIVYSPQMRTVERRKAIKKKEVIFLCLEALLLRQFFLCYYVIVNKDTILPFTTKWYFTEMYSQWRLQRKQRMNNVRHKSLISCCIASLVHVAFVQKVPLSKLFYVSFHDNLQQHSKGKWKWWKCYNVILFHCRVSEEESRILLFSKSRMYSDQITFILMFILRHIA